MTERADFAWANEASMEFLRRDYLLEHQTLEERVDVICRRASQLLGMPDFGERFRANLAKGWYSLSSPIWTNFGTDRGLPISCFGSHVDDSMESILRTHAEVGVMSKHGGGTSAYFGDVRGRGQPIKGGMNGKSSGSVHFMQMYDKVINVVSQGSSRRGQCAAYLPIEHDDTHEFLEIRTEGSPIQSLSTGVCVSDEFMQQVRDDVGDARKRWAAVLNSRASTGYPYIFFTDNANKNTVDVYREQGLQINHSNLCTEVMLPDSNLESFVCDLSSMNILYFDEWCGTDAVELLVFFLDAVMSEFIEKARNIWGMERAVRFAERHRALGIGWIGWHSYLQANRVPFESIDAKFRNRKVAETIQYQAHAGSKKLAKLLGEPELLKGYGRRNTTLTAIAPTKSSSFILGQVSEGIEPMRSNYYIRDVQKGKFTVRNPQLEEVLEEYGKNDEETWRSILENRGSVQHLGFMSDRDKSVFKTFGEITPMEVVNQAAQRQKFIDQGQSLNLIISPKVPVKEVNQLLFHAWETGIKSLYYQISVNAAQEFVRDILTCSSCES